MNKPELLLSRLHEIAGSLSKKNTALALIGLGSIGVELDRLDRFSDLDFFVIVTTGSKSHYLADLSWLTDIAPVAYYFLNTRDGYKLLYEDGVFCEFAIFEESELAQTAFAPGRVVWKAAGVDKTISTPAHLPASTEKRSTEWLIGEALTNLYIGLLRDGRGEKLSALRFIQGYAIDRILELPEQIDLTTAAPDPFNLERRYELRHPGLSQLLPTFLQGYDKNRESALAILDFLDHHFDLNAAMKQAVLNLCEAGPEIER